MRRFALALLALVSTVASADMTFQPWWLGGSASTVTSTSSPTKLPALTSLNSAASAGSTVKCNPSSLTPVGSANPSANPTISYNTTAIASAQTIYSGTNTVPNTTSFKLTGTGWLPYNTVQTHVLTAKANDPIGSSFTVSFCYSGPTLDIVKFGDGTGFGLWVDDVFQGYWAGYTTTGTAQAGASNTITLASGASATNGIYIGEGIKIFSGTGSGQVGVVTAYNGSTKVATVSANWVTNPDATSVYYVTADPRGYYVDGSSGSTRYINLSWATTGTHKVEIYNEGSFNAINIGPHDSLWPAPNAGSPRMVIIGDSYIANTGVPYPNSGPMASLIPRMIGAQGWPEGVAGSGWTQPGGSGTGLSFADRIAPPTESWSNTINNATAGTYTLSVTYNGSTQTTSALAYNATPATVQTAVQGLSNVPASSVNVGGGPSGALPQIIVLHSASGASLTMNTSGLTYTTQPALTSWLGSVAPRVPLDANGNPLPFILYVQGSQNDRGSSTSTAVQAAAVYTAQQIVARFPTAIAIFSGTVSTTTHTSGGVVDSTDVAFNTAIKAGAALLNPVNGNVPFIDTYPGGVGSNAWVTGTASIASPTNNTNDVLASAINSGHPAGDGHLMFSSRISQGILYLLGAQ